MRSMIFLAGMFFLIVGFSSAQNNSADRTTLKGTGSSTITERKSFSELALEMILADQQSGFLDGFVDSEEYIIGPGDEFEISFVSGNQSNIAARVNSQGQIFIKSVGTVELGYVSLQQGIKNIRTAVEKNFKALEFAVQMKHFRFSRISVIGQVRNPGTYYVPATWRVSEVIDLAGGLKSNASLRKIVIRGFGNERPVDLVKYNAIGDLSANPMTSCGNSIYIPEKSISQGYVSVSGQVSKPGSFEYSKDTPGQEYLEFSGDLIGNPDELFASILSIDGRKTEIRLDDPNWTQFTPRLGDNIVVDWSGNSKRFGFVTITGEVLRPGTYPLMSEQVELTRLLEMCGGITEKGCLERLEIYRLSLRDRLLVSMMTPDAENFTASSENRIASYILSSSPRSQSSAQVHLITDKDSVYIPAKTGVVSVQGAVASPGLIPFMPGKSTSYYIDLAGGYSPDADQQRVVVVNPVSGGTKPADAAGSIFDGEILMVPRKEILSK